MGQLDGKVALITGGASGIGEATVAAFLPHSRKQAVMTPKCSDAAAAALRAPAASKDPQR